MTRRAYQSAMFGYNARAQRWSDQVSSKFETAFERLLFASRWILAPIFLGLSLALLALGIKFFEEAFHVVTEALVLDEATLVLKVLAMIDIVLVGSLIVMVMFSGYENFVSTIDAKGSDSLNWLGKLDAGTLKLKVAASIVAISSIHLLRIFMQVDSPKVINGVTVLDKISGLPVDKYTNDQIMWYVILHMTFVLSAVLLGVLDKMSFSKHRDH